MKPASDEKLVEQAKGILREYITVHVPKAIACYRSQLETCRTESKRQKLLSRIATLEKGLAQYLPMMEDA